MKSTSPITGLRCFKRTRRTPFLILFTRQDSTMGFQSAHLAEVAFHANTEAGHQPPHQLTVVFLTHTVTLKGWRLDALAQPLANGKISGVQALPPPVPLPPGKTWIAEIQITARP